MTRTFPTKVRYCPERPVIPMYHPPPMRRTAFLVILTLLAACAAPPAPTAAPETPAPPKPAETSEARVMKEVRVNASALNVRKEPSTDGDVVTQVKKGQMLGVLEEKGDWVKVRVGDETGWVAARFVGDQKEGTKKKKGCESDFAFIETPTLAFSDSSAHGIVVVEANVNTKGIVTSTKVVSNSTGDEALAFLAQKEIRAAKFSPPMRNCAPRAFIFTYRRTF